MHTFCSSLTKYSSTKSVQTRFVASQKPLINTFLVVKVIISYDNFIAIDPMKKVGARFSFSDFTYKNLSTRTWFNPIQARLLLPFKGPRGSLGTPLMISGTIKASPMKLCTAIVLLKAYQNTERTFQKYDL